MQTRHWLCGIAAALALALTVPAAHAAPLGTAIGDGRTVTEPNAGGVQAVHWRDDRYYYYRHGYWPRRHYRYYGYRYRPYRYYYGYGPAFGFYGYPRYYDRWWW